MSKQTNSKKGDTMKKYTPKTKDELKALVMDESIHLGDIDTSNITDMSELFMIRDEDDKIITNPRTDFSGIEKWNVSNVTDMRDMFAGCSNFNQDINSWDVSNVENMGGMFARCENFNQDLSSWDVSNVKNMEGMFENCHKFNQDISSWNVSNVENMSLMFFCCYSFNQSLNKWNTSKVKNLNCIFRNAKITQEQAFSGQLKNKKDDKNELVSIVNQLLEYNKKNDEEKENINKELRKAFEIISNRLEILATNYREMEDDKEIRADLLIMSKILAKIDNQLKDTISTVKRTQLNFEEAVIEAVTANMDRLNLQTNESSLKLKLAIEQEKNRARELKLEILKMKKRK